MTAALDEKYIDGNIPEPYQWVQATLDRFVEINYDAALDAVRLHAKEPDAGHLRQQLVDIIRNNPPLKSVPTYFRDDRANYLWYSDFYDDATKDVYLKQYGKFTPPTDALNPANYATELAKIDLPYFRALVDLVSLAKQIQYAEAREAARKDTDIPAPTTEPAEPENIAQVDEVAPVEEPAQPTPQPQSAPEPEPPAEKPTPKRSYEPNLTNEQYSLLAGCVERIKLFRRPASAAQLKKLFAGKLAEPLQVMNQLPLVFLLDQLREHKFIKKAWMTTAYENRDFISFRTPGQERRYGPGPHYLTMEQLKSRRTNSKRAYIDGGDEIEDTIEAMRERGAGRQ